MERCGNCKKLWIKCGNCVKLQEIEKREKLGKVARISEKCKKYGGKARNCGTL